MMMMMIIIIIIIIIILLRRLLDIKQIIAAVLFSELYLYDVCPQLQRLFFANSTNIVEIPLF